MHDRRIILFRTLHPSRSIRPPPYYCSTLFAAHQCRRGMRVLQCEVVSRPIRFASRLTAAPGFLNLSSRRVARTIEEQAAWDDAFHTHLAGVCEHQRAVGMSKVFIQANAGRSCVGAGRVGLAHLIGSRRISVPFSSRRS